MGEGDVLFIDSSHVVTLGSDVLIEVLEILPRLAAGVWVHVHDIFFPADYPAEWVLERRLAFNEQYFLEAFLAFNSAFSVRLANHWLTTEVPDLAAGILPPAFNASGAAARGASSLWLRKDR